MITSSFKKGDRGEQVKAYQQMLIDNGYLDKKYNTGYYGDLTESATKKFQSSGGLNSDGVASNLTQKALINSKSADYLDNHPELMGTPEGDLLKQWKTSNPQLYYQIASRATSGSMFTAGQLKTARDQSIANTSKYYEQDQQNYTGALKDYLNSTQNSYNSSVNAYQNQGGVDFNTLTDKEGRDGTWGSSARNDRMKSLENNYNSKLTDLYNTSQADIRNKLQQQEYNYGASATPQVNLSQTKANFDSSPSFSSTSSNVYNPFNFVGRKKAEQSAGIQSGTSKYLSSQAYSI